LYWSWWPLTQLTLDAMGRFAISCWIPCRISS
jgi:hypothetical protein